jgi:transketolase
MFRAVCGSTVLYPSDATSTASLVRAMADRDGVVYMRTTRGAYPVIYGPDEQFGVGGAKVVRASDDDQVTLIGAGVTLHNCLAAADELAGRGIVARVVDLYSVRPIDTETLLAAAAATNDRIVVVEDHYPAGGIGGAVLEAFSDAGHPVAIKHLAVRGLPGSGTPQELMRAAGISVGDIVRAASEATENRSR